MWYLVRTALFGMDTDTIESHSRFLVMDTHALQEMGENIQRAQYFLIMLYSWRMMSWDREERLLFIADEAYLMVDQKVPQAMVYLRNMMKRARSTNRRRGHALFIVGAKRIHVQFEIPEYKFRYMGKAGER